MKHLPTEKVRQTSHILMMRHTENDKQEEMEGRERDGRERWKGERDREKGIEERILSFFVLILLYIPQTPLHWAVGNGSLECVNTLIKNGADVSAKDVMSERVCEGTLNRRRHVWGFVIS